MGTVNTAPATGDSSLATREKATKRLAKEKARIKAAGKKAKEDPEGKGSLLGKMKGYF